MVGVLAWASVHEKEEVWHEREAAQLEMTVIQDMKSVRAIGDGRYSEHEIGQSIECGALNGCGICRIY